MKAELKEISLQLKRLNDKLDAIITSAKKTNRELKFQSLKGVEMEEKEHSEK